MGWHGVAGVWVAAGGDPGDHFAGVSGGVQGALGFVEDHLIEELVGEAVFEVGKLGHAGEMDAEELIAAKLADGYLVDPSVSIQVAEARPFYIMGEVKNPGGYKYAANMTALSAVAMAGGFTYRARQNFVNVTRGDAQEKIPVGDKILPGDVITVDERFF